MNEQDGGAIARSIVDSNRYMQAVYMSAVAAEMTGVDLERGARREITACPSALDFKCT